MKQKKRTPAQQARNNLLKREAAKRRREEALTIKAEKELQQIKSERRQRPEVMWERLLDGQLFEDVKLNGGLKKSLSVTRLPTNISVGKRLKFYLVARQVCQH